MDTNRLASIARCTTEFGRLALPREDWLEPEFREEFVDVFGK